MLDINTDRLVERYAMGQAYLDITGQLGPSAQLLAFINYDRVTASSIGLESLELVDQHDQVLAQIDADPALSMACESFSTRLKSTLERVKNAVTFNRHDNLNDLASSPLEVKKSNILVVKQAHFASGIKAIDDAFKLLNFILPKIPTGTSGKDWEKFYAEHVKAGESGELSKLIRLVSRSHQIFDEKGRPLEFEKSGWNETNFRTGLKSLGKYQQEIADHQARINDACGHVSETLDLIHSSAARVAQDNVNRRYDVADSVHNAYRDEHDDRKKHWVHDAMEKTLNEHERQQNADRHQRLMNMIPSHVLSSMNKITLAVDSATTVVYNVERWMYRSLVDVSRHYDIVHK